MNFFEILRVLRLLPGLAALLFLAACQSQLPDNSEFVRTVNFSDLQTYRYKHTLTSGLEWRDANRLVLEELSPEVVGKEMTRRGFEAVETGEDILVVVKWRKAASAYQSPFDSIDGPVASLGRRESAPGFSSRISLVVELYEGPDSELFWRKELYNAFDAIQFTTSRITRTLQKALDNFPERVERDPNLPSIQ